MMNSYSVRVLFIRDLDVSRIFCKIFRIFRSDFSQLNLILENLVVNALAPYCTFITDGCWSNYVRCALIYLSIFSRWHLVAFSAPFGLPSILFFWSGSFIENPLFGQTFKLEMTTADALYVHESMFGWSSIQIWFATVDEKLFLGPIFIWYWW